MSPWSSSILRRSPDARVGGKICCITPKPLHPSPWVTDNCVSTGKSRIVTFEIERRSSQLRRGALSIPIGSLETPCTHEPVQAGDPSTRPGLQPAHERRPALRRSLRPTAGSRLRGELSEFPPDSHFEGHSDLIEQRGIGVPQIRIRGTRRIDVEQIVDRTEDLKGLVLSSKHTVGA